MTQQELEWKAEQRRRSTNREMKIRQDTREDHMRNRERNSKTKTGSWSKGN